MQCAGAAKKAEELKKKNRKIILNLMRSIYFLAKNRKHLSEGPSNAQDTSRFRPRVLIEAIDNWI